MQLDPKKHATPLAFFLATNRKEVKWLFIVGSCYALAITSVLIATYYVGRLVDLLSPAPHGPIALTIGIIIAGIVMREVFYRVGHMFEVMAGARFREKIKRDLFNHVASLSYGYFTDRFSGQIAHKIAATTDGIERMFDLITNEFTNGGAVFVVGAVMLAFVSPALGLFLLAWIALFTLGIFPYAKRLNDASNEYADAETMTSGVFVDFFTNITSVKVYGSESHALAYAQVAKEKKAYKRLGLWSVLSYNYIGLSSIVLCAGFIAVATYLFVHGRESVGDVVFLSGVVIQIFGVTWDLGLGIIQFIRQRGEAGQNLKDLIVAPAVADTAGAVGASSESISVAYDNVTFAYGDKSPVLEHFSLTVPAGQKVGIVGLSGAGKTTFANLLLRFFDVQSGSVRINDTDVRELPQAYLRSHISYISQDTSLFHMTIAENVAYGMPDATEDTIAQAAKLAYADEFIATLPEKYQSVVGERGIKLSGGQRQRIAIARAILANRPLFLLDEATSALDSDSEAKIQKGLEVLMEGKTVIAIAHRLSTLSHMDRIIYLEGGKILEDGTHMELLAKNGKYAQLWHMQAGGFLPS